MSTAISSPDAVVRTEPPAAAPPLSLRERFRTGWQLAKLRVKEYVQFDARVLHSLAAVAAGWLATALLRTGQFNRAFNLLAKFHRGAYSQRLSDRTERFVRTAYAERDPRFFAMLDRHVANVVQMPQTANFWADPLRILGTAALVLKSATPGRKGVLIVKYHHVFPLFARFFDLARISERYHIVLEPSWSGYCDRNILLYTKLPNPVFVQASEPYDARFVTSLSSNLVPVPLSANWWVDHRLLRPLRDVEKVFDVVMVAGWGSYKRHHRFFDALSRLRRQGHRLKVLLLGYSVGWTKEMILRHARYYGVDKQLEVLDSVPYDEMNGHLNRARVHLLWSRHEGVNRAIIEAMLAGLPCIVREGFNYGHHYPYINEKTGRFSSERALPRVLLEMISDSANFAPREWVLENMTSCRAADVLARTIEATVGENGGDCQGQVVAKINALHAMRYLDDSLRSRFETDYAYLADCRL